MRQKVGKERSQEGAAPLANPRRYPNLAEPSCEPPPAGKSYELRRVARPARGGGGSRDPTGRRFSTCRPIPRHPPPKTTQPNGHWPRAWAEISPWRPVAHPLEALQNPGWSAQQHRIGRRPEGRNYPRPKLDFMPSPSYCRLVETGGQRYPRRRAATFATLTCAAAGVSRETAPPDDH